MRVVLTSEGICPSCRRSFAEEPNVFGDSPYTSTSRLVRRELREGMTLGEKLYTAVVILGIMFLLASLASLHLVMIPRMEDPRTLYFIAFMQWLVVAVFAITAGMNLYCRRLLIIPTALQCILLCLMIYLLPVGIWGGVLLYRRINREKVSNGVASA